MSDSVGKAVRRAVLVIHGMGRQRRFEALADFSLGLIRYGLPGRLRDLGASLVRELWQGFRLVGLELFQHASVTLRRGLDVDTEVFRFDGGFDTRVVLSLPADGEGSPATELDIYEAHWAPVTGGKTNLMRVLLWLASTTWVALKNGLVPTDRRPRFGEFLVELFRLGLVFGLFLGILGGLFTAARRLTVSFLFAAGGHWWRYDTLYFTQLVIWVYLSFLGVQIVQGLLFRTLKLSWYQVMVVGSLVAGMGWLIWTPDYRGIRGELWWFGLLVLLCVLTHTVFVDYIGDVEVYISGSDIGRDYRTRREIIGRARAKLEYILRRVAAEEEQHHPERPLYDSVIVVGHSLGSAIAYDLLCRMLRPEAGKDSRGARERVTHFITVGSPLDKIWYFFRDRSHSRNPIYQGILAKLKGTKTAGDRDSPLASLEWSNLWCLTDVISGGLEEYGDEIENIHVNGLIWPPLVNHVRYWTSSEVMRLIGNRVFQTQV